MTGENLPPPTVWRAIEVYVAHAYDGAIPPSAVRKRLDTLRSLPPEDFYANPAFERGEGEAAATGNRLSLRLGNRFYPHMKLVLERRPDGLGYVFRVDGHDQHVLASSAGSACEAFQEVVQHDAVIAAAIEVAWAQQGLTTVRQFVDAHAEEMDRITSTPV